MAPCTWEVLCDGTISFMIENVSKEFVKNPGQNVTFCLANYNGRHFMCAFMKTKCHHK
jgi:hypothetical protein